MNLPDNLRDTAEYFDSFSTGVHPQRTVWIRQAADKIERLESCGADAIGALRACLANPQLSPGQRGVAQEALEKMFTEQERWFGGPGRDPENR